VEAVLEGRIAPSLEHLVRLIRQVNPSGRALSPQQTSAAYARKSALQSLLIARFGDRFTAAPDGDGIVLLRHKTSGRDACHARVQDLDDAARLWIRRRETTPPPSTPPPGGVALPPATPPSVPVGVSPLSAGQEALAAYDYPLGKRCFEVALDDPETAPAGARALVELLVDHLCQDAEALSLAARLPHLVREDPQLQATLSLAAARTGRLADARRWGRRAEGEREIELRLALADAALADEDTDAAERDLNALAALAPAHPGARRLRARLDTLLAAQLQPALEELSALLRSERWSEAAARAAEVLAQWPRSAAAQAGLRQAKVALHAQRRSAALTSARRAADAAEWDRAHTILRRISDGSAEVRALESLVSAERSRRRQEEEDEVVDRCSRALRAPTVDALIDWTRLSPTLRARVKERLALPMLEWLESCPGFTRRTQAAALAVLELQRVERELAETPDAVLQVLETHARELGGLSAAHRLEARARDLRAARERERQAQLLDQVRSLLADGDPEGALVALDELDALADGSQEEAQAALRSRALAAQRSRLRQAELDRAENSGDTLGAWEAASHLAEQAQEVLAVARRRLLEAWRFERVDTPLPLRDVTASFEEQGVAQLDPTGSLLLHAESVGRWIFIWMVEVDSGRCTSGASLRVPTEVPHVMVTWEDNRWRLIGDRYVLDLAPDTLEPIAWLDLSWALPGGQLCEQIQPTGDPRYIWLQGRTLRLGGFDIQHFQVIDVEQRQSVRSFDDLCYARAILRPDGPVVVGFSTSDSATVRTPRGSRFPPGSFRHDAWVRDATAHPSRPELVFLSDAQTPGVMAHSSIQTMLNIVDGSATTRPGVRLPDVDVERVYGLVTDHAQGRIYLSSDELLLEIAPAGTALEVTSRTPIRARLSLYADHQGRHVAAGWCGPEGLVLQRLMPGANANIGASPVQPLPPLVDFTDLGVMTKLDRAGRAQRNALASVLQKVSPVEIDSWIADYLQAHEGDLRAQVALLSAFERSPDHQYNSSLRSRLEALDGPFSVLNGAWAAITSADWPTALDATNEIPADQHLPALLRARVIALIGTGATAEASELLEQNIDVFDTAQPQALITSLVSEPGGEPADFWGRLVCALRQADDDHHAQRWDSLISALDHPELWKLAGVQVAARRAAAWLNIDAPDAITRFSKRRALTRLRYSMESRILQRHIPLGDLAWTADRVAEIAEAADAWLGDRW